MRATHDADGRKTGPARIRHRQRQTCSLNSGSRCLAYPRMEHDRVGRKLCHAHRPCVRTCAGHGRRKRKLPDVAENRTKRRSHRPWSRHCAGTHSWRVSRMARGKGSTLILACRENKERKAKMPLPGAPVQSGKGISKARTTKVVKDVPAKILEAERTLRRYRIAVDLWRK